MTQVQGKEPSCVDKSTRWYWPRDQIFGTKDATFTARSNDRLTGYGDVTT